jgi:hypothetical protein
MLKKILCLPLIALVLLYFQSCTSWHSLKFETEKQPIQFGPHLQNTILDTLGVISGISRHNFEEDTFAESEHMSVVFKGKDEVKENITTTIYKALYDDPQHFIADGQVIVEVEHGISMGSIFLGMIASFMTDDDPDVGTYSIESIYYNGIVYKINTKQLKDEK